MYLISPGPFYLGPEVLHGLVQTPVTAQLRLYRRQVRPPLGLIEPSLVLLHPGQQVLDVAQGDVVQLRAGLHDGRLGGLGHGGLGGGGGLQAEVVVAAEVDQTLVEAVNPEGVNS